MDFLTHTAAGLFLSRAGLNRWTPRATPILMLAANAPDIDVLSLSGGPLNYLHYHRHLTHSLMLLPVMALLPVALVRAVSRKPIPWLSAFSAAAIAVATHLLLDLTNSYGLRLLLPFSARWLRLDLTSLFDLWIWAVLLLAVAGPFLNRLVGAEITSGAAHERNYGSGFAILGLLFLLLYNCGRAVLHARAVATLESRVYQNAAPLRVGAFPDSANPFRWHGVIETSDFYAIEDVNLAREFDPTRAMIFDKPSPEPALDAARSTRTIQEFLQFSQYPLWRVTPAAEPLNAKEVEVIDMRFGNPLTPGFTAGALVDSDLRVLRTSFHFGLPRPR